MARLKELIAFGFTIDKIVTFMCGGVAARIQNDAFMARLKELKELGFTIDKIVTFMSNSVAARIQDDVFMARLEELKELGFTIDKIVAFMCDGVAARIQDDAFILNIQNIISHFKNCRMSDTDAINAVIRLFRTSPYIKIVPKITQRIMGLQDLDACTEFITNHCKSYAKRKQLVSQFV